MISDIWETLPVNREPPFQLLSPNRKIASQCVRRFVALSTDERRDSHGHTQLVELSYISSNACSPRINASTPSVSVTSPNTVAR